jgi:aminopeptidase YwaD
MSLCDKAFETRDDKITWRVSDYMTDEESIKRAGSYLQELCERIPSRCVGCRGNRDATDFFAQQMESFGFQVELPEFDCMDWSQQGASLSVGGNPVEAQVSPYSLGGRFKEPLAVVSSLAELESVEAEDRILLVRGALTREQLMPKSFTFYNPDEHKRIIRLLEEKKPQAIIAATSRNPEMAGAVYPFPLIEDGDFDIPSVYLTEEAGVELANHAGEQVSLDICAQRSPAKGCNVIAHKGKGFQKRVVCFAHIDSKQGTPGALDNASGVTILLLLAELLRNYDGALGIELVALNGEDYYSNPGEMLYLNGNKGRFDEILLGINLDGVGYREGDTAYSLYGCPEELANPIREVFSHCEGIVEGEPWVQGDHMLFVINQRPALALTSTEVLLLMNEIVHTPEDRVDVVDSKKLVQAAQALHTLLQNLRG